MKKKKEKRKKKKESINQHLIPPPNISNISYIFVLHAAYFLFIFNIIRINQSAS
jgi:hypothetical protein